MMDTIISYCYSDRGRFLSDFRLRLYENTSRMLIITQVFDLHVQHQNTSNNNDWLARKIEKIIKVEGETRGGLEKNEIGFEQHFPSWLNMIYDTVLG